MHKSLSVRIDVSNLPAKCWVHQNSVFQYVWIHNMCVVGVPTHMFIVSLLSDIIVLDHSLIWSNKLISSKKFSPWLAYQIFRHNCWLDRSVHCYQVNMFAHDITSRDTPIPGDHFIFSYLHIQEQNWLTIMWGCSLDMMFLKEIYEINPSLIWKLVRTQVAV